MDINHLGLALASLFQYSSNWNIILLIIVFCSLTSFTIFIERFLFLKKSEIDTNNFIINLRKIIKDGDIVESIRHCEKTGGTNTHIVTGGLLKHDRAKEQIENTMEIAGMIEIAQLEKNAKVLSIIAHLSPLIGLLGTVLGFIQAFSEMRASGLADISASQIGAAMEYALVTTAAGLVVAIPSVLGYNYIVSRIEGFVLEIQTTSHEIVDMLMQKNEDLGGMGRETSRKSAYR